MIATRRRGYIREDKYPVIEVLHPDAFLFTWTGGDISFLSTWMGRECISKIILDGVVYEGSDRDQVLTYVNNFLAFHPANSGYHEAYMYINETSGYFNFYKQGSRFTLIRYPRTECRSSHQGYDWESFMFTGNYIKYANQSGGSITGPIYIPYKLEVDEYAYLYKGKYVRVKYKFIEDE